MFGKRALSAVLLLPLCVCSFAQKVWQKTFSSPNGKIEWKAEGASNKVKAFDITYRDGQGKVEVLKIAGYGLLTKNGGGKELSLQSVSEPRLLKEHYKMLLGKKSECSNEANEIVYSFVDQLQRPMRMVVRLYNDGVAFYGEEWYNNLPVLTNKAACHNATLPFTRGIVGLMDYTPCAFSDSQHPHITTNAHELALPVLYESALTHWADKPESYLAQPKAVQDFISQLPTTWDETRLLGGCPGEYVVMARRKGNTWYQWKR